MVIKSIWNQPRKFSWNKNLCEILFLLCQILKRISPIKNCDRDLKLTFFAPFLNFPMQSNFICASTYMSYHEKWGFAYED